MDIKKLLSSFNAHKVVFVVIGAAAFPVHGYDRSTQDIDLFIKPTRDNAARTRDALRSVGYDITDLSVEDLLSKKTLFRQYILDTDIHPFVKGVTFDAVWKRRVRSLCSGVPVYFSSLTDLILMKKAAGRPKDLDDLSYLKKIKQLKARKKKT